jgi:hypothetical protein
MLPRTERLIKQRASLLDEFFKHYGAQCIGTCDDAPCPEQVSDPEALTIGHLFNDGAKYRKDRGKWKARGGISVLRILRDKGWPKDQGVATQCGNCQLRDLRRMRRRQAIV